MKIDWSKPKNYRLLILSLILAVIAPLISLTREIPGIGGEALMWTVPVMLIPVINADWH